MTAPFFGSQLLVYVPTAGTLAGSTASQVGCGTVSHTDSCEPRWKVLMYDGPVSEGPASRLPGELP
ncbi:hypothetical protein SVIOM74S_05855 [Streptomyces violarus]